jgi:hypothetical protein
MALLMSLYAAPSLGQDSSTTTAPGDTGESKVKMDDVDKSSWNSVKGDQDADDILTNNKLRAESGSKSRLSVASTLTYNGGTVSQPFGQFRPDITTANGQSQVSDIEGGISIKYNLTTLDSLVFGETVRYITPVNSATKVPTGYAGDKFDNFNPNLYYQRIYKMGGWQSYVQVGPTIYTQSDLTKIGYLGNMSVYNAAAYDFKGTNWSVGTEMGVAYSWFQSPVAHPDSQLMTAQDTAAASSDWDAFAYPYVEYRINDKLNVRTVCMWFQAEHTLARPEYNIWKKDKAQQSVGVGISVTRDVFLYPNVQFIPDQVRGSQTNVSLATDINLF